MELTATRGDHGSTVRFSRSSAKRHNWRPLRRRYVLVEGPRAASPINRRGRRKLLVATRGGTQVHRLYRLSEPRSITVYRACRYGHRGESLVSGSGWNWVGEGRWWAPYAETAVAGIRGTGAGSTMCGESRPGSDGGCAAEDSWDGAVVTTTRMIVSIATGRRSRGRRPHVRPLLNEVRRRRVRSKGEKKRRISARAPRQLLGRRLKRRRWGRSASGELDAGSD